MTQENHTDVQAWSVADLVNSLSDKPSKKQKILIPKYQRSLVWNKDKKDLFIKSIKLGYPIGSLLLYKAGTSDNNTIYSLTDGLQRSSTLLDYSRNPTKYFDAENISDEVIKDVLKFIKTKKHSTDDVKRVIVDWIKGLKGFEESMGFSARSLSDEVDDKLNLELTKDKNKQLGIILQTFTESVKKEANIFDFKIPIVIYTGEESNLPLIFERLNQQGTKLSKYQIYAATWANDKLKIKNKEIVKLIAAKYENMIKEGLEIENFNTDIDTFAKEDFSVFEYFFGLSKYLADKYPSLLGDEKDEEGVAFNLSSVCLDISIKLMDKKTKDSDNLPKKFLKVVNKYGQDKFELALFDSIQIVKDFLKPFVELTANRKSNKKVKYHTEFQIISIIGKVFKSKYEADFSISTTWKSTEQQLKQNVPYHYLYDILRGKWNNSGDSKSFNRSNARHYELPLNTWTWTIALDEWFLSEIKKVEKSRANISEISILFLKYIYTHTLSVHEENSKKAFDIEHIVPIGKLKAIVGDKGLPMSAISNLCLLDTKINRAKGSQTFYEYFDELKATETKNKIKLSDVEKYTFTERKDLAFVYKKEVVLDAYQEFLKKRFQKLKEKFLELNKVEKGDANLSFNFDD